MLISLFVTCYNDTLFPNTGKAVVRVLERLGHTVEFREAQTCCGQMHYNTGYQRDAYALMLHFMKAFGNAKVICVPSSSCVAMIRDHFPKMAARARDIELSRQVSELIPRVFEFTELLCDELHVTDVGAYFPHAVTYHPSCHGLRSLNLADKPLQLLRHVEGLSLVELGNADQCCGFGGTFSIKNPEVSAAMLADKARCVLNTGAEVCTATDNSCLMQIGGSLSRQKAGMRCLHIAEILAAEARDVP